MSPLSDSAAPHGPLYALFRWLARTTLRWFYRDIAVLDADRMPASGPVLLAVNHMNALVDALTAVSVVARPLRITAKATLFGNRLLAPARRAVGIVPLRRAADEPSATSALSLHADGAVHAADPQRNRASFDALLAALEAEAAILIFPEGTSHSGSELAPLKSGLGRLARARTCLRLRRDAELRASLRTEATRLWDEAQSLESCASAAAG